MGHRGNVCRVCRVKIKVFIDLFEIYRNFYIHPAQPTQNILEPFLACSSSQFHAGREGGEPLTGRYGIPYGIIWFSGKSLQQASVISTDQENAHRLVYFTVSMPCNGLLSFLRYPPGTRINTGFQAPFLQVIHRIF